MPNITLTLTQMNWELDGLAASPCLSPEARQAAKHASELLRSMRSSLDLGWGSSASDLHTIGCNVEPNAWLDKCLGPDGKGSYFLVKE